MATPWWKKLDLVQVAGALMALKVLLPYSRIIPYSDTADTILLVAALGFFASLFWLRGMERKTLLVGVVLCGAAVYTSMRIDDFSILITVLTIFVLASYRVKDFIRVVFWVELLFCLTHVLYSAVYALVISPEPFLLLREGRVRFDFGFGHPNTFSSVAASVLMMYLWLYGKRHFKRRVLAVAAIQIVLFLFTDSRTSLLTGMLSLVLLIWARWRQPTKLMRFAVCVVIPTLTVFMLLMMRMYINGNGFAMKINDLLNNRIRLGAYAYDRLGLSLAGQYVPFHRDMQWDAIWGLTTFTFDNAYSYLLVQGGLLWVAVLCFAFIRFARKASARDCVFLLSWAIYGMCENTVLNGYFMFPIFLLAEQCVQSKRRLRNNDGEKNELE